MNEVVFLLAILVHKEVITKREALVLQRSLSENIINGDLNQMITKVEKAFVTKEKELKTIDAKDLLSSN